MPPLRRCYEKIVRAPVKSGGDYQTSSAEGRCKAIRTQVLELQEFLDAVVRTLATQPALLYPTEWHHFAGRDSREHVTL